MAWFLACLATVQFIMVGNAEEGAPAPVSETPSAQPSPKPVKKKRGPREKETDGTQALDRFEANTVLKSQYQLNGQPLEVDPD